MAPLSWLKAVQEASEAEGFTKVEETPQSVRYSHEQRDGGCSVEVFPASCSVRITMAMESVDRLQTIILRSVRGSDLVKLFRNPGAKIVRRMPNPFFLIYRLTDAESRRFFRSSDAPIDGTLESISLGYASSTYLLLYKDGSFAHSEGVPQGLFRRLLDRREEQPRPELIRLGKRSQDTFFLQFTDWSMEWKGLPGELEAVLVSSSVGVEELALGEDEDYYVRLQDGRESWRVPETLAALLDGRLPGQGGEVMALALGEGGDYFVKLHDGTTDWRASNEVVAALAKFKGPDSIKVELGRGGEFVVMGKRSELLVDPREENRAIKREMGDSDKNSNLVKKSKIGESAEPGCICHRTLGLVHCLACGGKGPGRIRRVCPSHPLAVYSMDRFSCPRCGQIDLSKLEEKLLVGSGGRVTNKKVLG